MRASNSSPHRAAPPCNQFPTAVITQSDLDQVLVGDSIVADWEPEKYTYIKTVGGAASGRGSRGRVELMSREEQLHGKVAVKRLPFHLIRASAEDFEKHVEDKRERPWTDIALLKLLNRCAFPFVCRFFGIFRGKDEVNIVTSFATKGDLLTWVEDDTTEQGQEREAAMRPIVLQMFKAVRWLHDLGIAHRDLSAENVLLTDGNGAGMQVKIIDFGMATLSRTAQEEVRGKRSYQAPEMHRRFKYDTLLVDNFALGVTVYVMGTHRLPWRYTTPEKSRSFDFACQHGLDIFLQRKDSTGAGKLSPSLQELLCGLLAFDPEMRHSLGEKCFHPLFKSKSTCLLEDALSEITTGCSSAETSDSEDFHSKCAIAQPLWSRSCVWDCDWLEEYELY